MKYFPILLILVLFLTSCSRDEDVVTPDAQIHFQFKFDASQERLNNIGAVSTIPAGHAAQSPGFNSMSGYFIELVPDRFTQIREGAVIYEAATQSSANPNFEEAVIFDQAIVSDEGVNFLSIPIKDIPAGTYEYLRISVTYQNADIRFNLKNLPPPFPASLDNQLGTMAGFIGFNTHLSDLKIKDKSISVNEDKPQGFWAFEPQLDPPFQSYFIEFANPQGVYSGQSPGGQTTVVNPLEQFGVTLPFGSCIVTGKLDQPLTINSTTNEDINIQLSFSVNNSFEWVDDNGNGEWDFDVQNGSIEQPVDMGLRGLKVFVD